MATIGQSLLLVCLWMIHYFCQHNVSAFITPQYTKVTLHRHNPTYFSSRPTWPTPLSSSLKGDEDDDDGWGNDLPVETTRQPETRTTTTVEPERDLFIPIFAIISIAGLFGSYGYEMLRLQANGELYLPWTH